MPGAMAMTSVVLRATGIASTTSLVTLSETLALRVLIIGANPTTVISSWMVPGSMITFMARGEPMLRRKSLRMTVLNPSSSKRIV